MRRPKITCPQASSSSSSRPAQQSPRNSSGTQRSFSRRRRSSASNQAHGFRRQEQHLAHSTKPPSPKTIFIGVLIDAAKFEASHQHKPKQQQEPDKALAGPMRSGLRAGHELQGPVRASQPERCRSTHDSHSDPACIHGSATQCCQQHLQQKRQASGDRREGEQQGKGMEQSSATQMNRPQSTAPKPKKRLSRLKETVRPSLRIRLWFKHP